MIRPVRLCPRGPGAGACAAIVGGNPRIHPDGIDDARY